MNSTQNRSSLSFAFPLFVGVVFGVCILYGFSWSFVTDDKFDELALGRETTVNFASVDGVRVHCEDLNDANLCFDDYRNLSSLVNITLWLGNSQLHAINQQKTGDVTASAILHRVAKLESKYLMTFSQPNASLQEHYLLLP